MPNRYLKRPDMRSRSVSDIYADDQEGTANRTYYGHKDDPNVPGSESYEEYRKHFHSDRMYPTEEGMRYFHSVDRSSRGSAANNRIVLPLTHDQSMWIRELFTGHPKNKSEFRDRADDMFNNGYTQEDHHAAENLAARLLEEDLLSWEVEGLARRTYTTI